MLIALSLVTSLWAYSPGASQFDKYLPELIGKNVALVVNHSSKVGNQHTIDVLVEKNVKVNKLFALEHGIRGDIDAGDEVRDGIDVITGVPVVSLYGKKKSPSVTDLKNIDVVVYDIQDIGVRFFTFITSLKNIIRSTEKNNVKIIILDRVNDRMSDVAGPILDKKLFSFVGAFPVPVVYGLSTAELINMSCAEGWIESCRFVKFVWAKGFTRGDSFSYHIKPSPNLNTQIGLKWYPSLAPFEATNISVGRGTLVPFTVLGHPNYSSQFSFKPQPIKGMSSKPKFSNQVCYGVDLNQLNPNSGFDLSYLFYFYSWFKKNQFFISESFFNKLVGDKNVLLGLKNGSTFAQVKSLWRRKLMNYKTIREKYLRY